MKNTIITVLASGVLAIGALTFSTYVGASDGPSNSFEEKVKQALASSARTESERKRDSNREPLKAMKFWGLQDDMKVVEIIPAGGWYTKLLAPVLRDKGELVLVSYERYFVDIEDFIHQAPFNKAKKVNVDMRWDYDNRHYVLNTDTFGIKNADMVLNIREYHNFIAEDKVKLNKAAFDALKPGGRYVIVDHSRRHMAPETFELRRREDPVKVILEVQAAGFVLEKSSDMFYKPDDELVYEVGRKTVMGNTDRFTLVFKKPE